jgi:PKD repeat protein
LDNYRLSPSSIALNRGADVGVYSDFESRQRPQETGYDLGFHEAFFAISDLSAQNSGPSVPGSTTALTASISSGSNVTFTWAFGDGAASASGATVPHVYAVAGTYTATVTATNAAGVVTATTRVVVRDISIAGLLAINDGPTQLGSSTTLSVTCSAGTNVSYLWNFGDDTPQQAGATVLHVYPAVGAYTATVTATNSAGQAVTSTRVLIGDVPVSGLSASNSSPTQLGNATALFSSINAGSNVIYTWNFGDGSPAATGPTALRSYTQVGTYTATVTATNSANSLVTSTKVTIIDIPVAGLAAVNDSPTALGSSTRFTASITSGSNVLYFWNFGDGSPIDSGALAQHAYPAIGIYTATVTATNGVSALAVTTRVTIRDASIVGLAAVNDSPTALGASTHLTASVAAGTNVVYSWRFGVGGATGTGATPTFVYPALGTYTATVTATNSLGFAVAQTQIVIRDAAITGLNASSTSPSVLGTSTQFTASVTQGTNVVFMWNFGDGTLPRPGAGHAYTYAAVGSYTATVTATNGVSTEVVSLPVVIIDVPIDQLSAENSSPVTIGDTTSFTASTGLGSNVLFTWDFGDGSAAVAGQFASHVYAAAGTYTARVTASNGAGSRIATTQVIVRDVPISGLGVVNDSPTVLGDSTAFTATTLSGTNVTYQWNFGDGTANAAGGQTSHRYDAVGIYAVTVTATNGVSVVVASAAVTVIDRAIRGVSVLSSSPTPLGNTTFFTASVDSGSNVLYSWDFGDGSASASGVNPVHVYTEPGVYTVTVTVTNSRGSERITLTIRVTAVADNGPRRVLLPLLLRQ